jgi:poly(ADP-ribose) glycohydrolase
MTNSTTYIADQQRIFTISNENNNFQSLVNLFSIKKEEYGNFSCLNQTICQLDFDFYNDLLPHIVKWASDHSQSKSIEPLQAGTTATIVYTAAQARYILANAFFLNTRSGYGTIDLCHLYNSSYDKLSIERVRCLIEYFRLSSQQDENREISIERYSYKNELPDWNKQDIPIQSSKINIFTSRMEDANEAQGFVDFANKHIHIHSIIPSATQEEILCKTNVL